MVSDLEREQRLDEIIAGYLDDLAGGHAPARAALLARHPDLAAELQTFFRDQDQFDRMAMPLRGISQPNPSAATDELEAQQATPRLSATQSFATRAPSDADPKPFVALPDSAATLADTPYDEDGLPPLSAALPQIAGYEILEEIGHGGMGVVYKARQINLKRLVAVKMMRGGANVRPSELARFKREAYAVARVHHPNVVQIHEVGDKNGVPYFCLELIPGGSLQKRLAGAALPPRIAAGLLITLARAMHFAHGQGIVHRDLKPANILLAGPAGAPIEQCIPKVTDFGLAKKLDDEIGGTRTGEIMGTPSYMSPEQASGRSKEVGPAADIYALGAILYELLTGRPPFKAATALDTVLQVLHDDPLPPSRLLKSCPRDLETICLKCLQKEPPRRYGSALELAEDLERFLESKTIRARPASLRERTSKWAWRNPGKAAAALVAAFVIMLILGFNFYLSEEVRHAREDAAGKTRQLAETEATGRLREECGLLLAEAQAALEPANLTDKDLDKAGKIAAKAKKNTDDEPRLIDLRERAERLLDDVQRLRVARADDEKLQLARDEAYLELYRTTITGTDAPGSLLRIRELVQMALEPFHVPIDAAAEPKISEIYNADEKRRIETTCFEVLLALAEAHARQGDKNKDAANALAMLDRAAAILPSTQIYHQRRVRYVAHSGDAAGARLERLKCDTMRPANALDQYLMGLDLIDEGKVTEGRQRLELALQQQRDLFWARFFLAVEQLKRAQHEQAKASLDVCIFQRPAFIWSYLIRGYIHGQLGEFAAAEGDFEIARKLQPEKIVDASVEYVLRVNRGAMLTRQLRFDEARVQFKKAIDVQPQQFTAYLYQAAVYQQQARWDEVAHQLLALHAGPLHDGRSLVMAAHRQQLSAAAKRQLDRGIDLVPAPSAPALALLHRERAQLYLANNDLKAALKDFELAIQFQPDGNKTHVDYFECGEIYLQLGRPQAAQKAAHAAVKHAQSRQFHYVPAYGLAAKCCLALHQYKEALGFLDLYLIVGRPSVELYELRVSAHLKLGNAAAIPGEYSRALGLRPKDASLLTARGMAYLANEALPLALDDFRQALAVNPRHAHAHAGLGEALVKLGHPVDGAKHAAKALELGPTESRTYYAAARAFALAGAALDAAPRSPGRSQNDKSEVYFDKAVQCLSQGLALCTNDRSRLEFWQQVRLDSERPGAVLYRLNGTERFRTLAARYDQWAKQTAGPKQD